MSDRLRLALERARVADRRNNWCQSRASSSMLSENRFACHTDKHLMFLCNNPAVAPCCCSYQVALLSHYLLISICFVMCSRKLQFQFPTQKEIQKTPWVSLIMHTIIQMQSNLVSCSGNDHKLCCTKPQSTFSFFLLHSLQIWDAR